MLRPAQPPILGKPHVNRCDSSCHRRRGSQLWMGPGGRRATISISSSRTSSTTSRFTWGACTGRSTRNQTGPLDRARSRPRADGSGPAPSRVTTRLVVLSMSSRRSVRLLVVPPAHPAADRCMDLASDPRNRMTGAQILFTSLAAEADDFEITDQWNDTGGNWWQGSRAPSFRTDPMDPVRQAIASRRGACT